MDAKALAAATADIVRAHVEAATAPLLERIAKLEAREVRDGKDGLGLAGAIIDRGGNLVVTLSDGTARELGPVVGKDGEAGPQGERGDDGAPGEVGKDGADAYPGEARGLYDPEAEYRARDVVAFNGSAFMAKADNPGELPGEGWMLLAGRGKRGDKGERGERGAAGSDGKDGAQPVAFAFDADAMTLVMILDDGNELEADFAPIAEKIVEAVRNA